MSTIFCWNSFYDTVDGRNLTPVEMENIRFVIGFRRQQVVSRSSEPSTVPHGFFQSKKMICRGHLGNEENRCLGYI